MCTPFKKITTPLPYLAIAGYFIYLQWGAGFADPDSFYHAGVSTIMGQKQIILKQFAWFTFNNFNGQFVDHQFLYHLLLAPFTLFISPLVVTKTIAVILAVLFFVVFDFILKRTGIRNRLIYIFILLTTSPFIVRLNLAKAGSLALILLLLGTYGLWHKKYTLLFFTTFLYVWTHAGWMSMGVVYFTWILARILTKDNPLPSIYGNNIFGMSTKYIRTLFIDRALWAIGGGVLFGIVFNPYFPNNLKFYWQQAVQIGLVNYQSVINVGNEWYPFPIAKLFTELIGIWIVFAVALAAFIFLCLCTQQNELRPRTRALAVKLLHSTILAGLWFTLTLKSARYVEYLAPTALIAGAFLMEISLRLGAWTYLKKYAQPHRALYRMLAFALLIFYIGWSAYESQAIRVFLTQTLPWTRFEKSSAYLAAHTPDTTLVFHTNWSDAPLLFFHNTHNRYMAGLDPTFFYLANPELFRRYIDIAQGSVHKPAEAIFNAFNTPYILITLPQDGNLNYQLKKEPRAQALFHDDNSIVYRYTP
ncbi:MAG: hypothetical protein HY981_04460 [Candidatus Magasanikbacteria bacterium]|nr:hypothetical protein [Candidatus Magasanikbacteria bacterium]